MMHTAKKEPKIVRSCSLPLTSSRRVDLIVTELAVIAPTVAGLELRELAPGVKREQVLAATEARLIVPERVPEMRLAA
jgi:acetate CoA/acetoacetate CoA-transferase beta subunit